MSRSPPPCYKEMDLMTLPKYLQELYIHILPFLKSKTDKQVWEHWCYKFV